MKQEWKDGVWMPYETVSPRLVMERQKLLDKVRFGGATVADDARIAVFLGDNETAYAVEDDNDWVFFEDVLFTPDDHDELVGVVSRVFEEAQ